jgi:hypothetical protein
MIGLKEGPKMRRFRLPAPSFQRTAGWRVAESGKREAGSATP